MIKKVCDYCVLSHANARYLRPKKILCVYCHMLKKTRVGRK